MNSLTKPVNSSISTSVKSIEGWYAELQENFEVTTHPLQSGLVTAKTNIAQPIHRWYSLKEGFSSDLPLWVVNRIHDRYGGQVSRVADPFLGGGTTGVSLALEGIAVDGIEYNPFIHLVSKVKAAYPRLHAYETKQAIKSISLEKPNRSLPLPKLTTFKNKKYFSRNDIQIFLHAVKQVRSLDASEDVIDFLLLGIAASIDKITYLRKDGRALRYCESRKPQMSATKAIQHHWMQMMNDLGQYEYFAPFNAYRGSSTEYNEHLRDNFYDLAFYSPPYLNNFDYSEIYKLELWMLNYVRSSEEWRSLRQHTLRSHPSVTFQREKIMDKVYPLKNLHENLLDISKKELLLENSQVKKILVDYFEDMYLAFLEQWRILKPGGYLVYVVANSRHKYLPIATDVILGEIAQLIGFQPLELAVLRKRNGRTRQKTFLRESAVFLQKPN